MKRFGNQILILFLIFSMFCPNGIARDLAAALNFSKEFGNSSVGSNEFISGDYPGAELMKVNLWGAVTKPGIHLIPVQTDLITLLSYAGGPTDHAKLSGVYIKRWSGGKETLIKVDAEDIIEGTNVKNLALQANDVVVVPKNKPFIGQDTLTFVTLVSSVLSVVALGFLLFKPK